MFFTHLLFEIGVIHTLLIVSGVHQAYGSQASIARSYIEIFIYYLITINIITFFVYGIDKLKAKKGMWRIPEATLLLLAVIGGSIGAWFGMAVWHHKTKHLKFKYDVPAILIIQLALLIYVYIRY